MLSHPYLIYHVVMARLPLGVFRCHEVHRPGHWLVWTGTDRRLWNSTQVPGTSAENRAPQQSCNACPLASEKH